MVLHIDENKRLVMKTGLAWAIVTFVFVGAFYLGVEITQLKQSDEKQNFDIENMNSRLYNLEKISSNVDVQTAIITTKLDVIQRDITEIKQAQKESSRGDSAEKD